MHLLVLSAFRPQTIELLLDASSVSMHLLVLSAFRPRRNGELQTWCACLNAPSGAQCFPTAVLDGTPALINYDVSMHLLVLSAFRLV